MNYNELKENIAEVVKPNNNQEITGQIMQDALFALIENLGAGWQFGGTAHPADKPSLGTDTRAFYIAVEKGAYTEFGGLEVTELTALMYDDQWYAQPLGVAFWEDTEAEIGVLAERVSALEADGSVTTARLADGAVTSAKIADYNVIGKKIASGAITNDKIRAGAVSADKIAADAVVTEKIKDGAVTSAKIADYNVIGKKIASGAITNDKIRAGAVSADKIAADAVVTEKIKDGAVTEAKIDAAYTEKVSAAIDAKLDKAAFLTDTEVNDIWDNN